MLISCRTREVTWPVWC